MQIKPIDNQLPYEIASRLAISNELTTVRQYKKGYSKTPGLPKYPDRAYHQQWKQFGGWNGFLGKERVNHYSTFEEASNAAQALGIDNYTSYVNNYKKDTRLPSHPPGKYKNEWLAKGGWSAFLPNQDYYKPRPRRRGENRIEFYSSWKEASKAASILGIRTFKEYLARYIEDPRLPCKPDTVYQNEWEVNGKWYGFLSKPYEKYGTYEEACYAVSKLGISSQHAYRSKYKLDPMLPSNPSRTYSESWIINGRLRGFLDGWCFQPGAPNFIQIDKDGFFLNYKDASKACTQLGIRSREDYQLAHLRNIFLCRYPEKKYRDEWSRNGGWPGYLGTARKYYSNLAEMKKAVTKLGIKSSNEYRRRYSEDPKLHRYPHKFYGDKWIESGRWLYIFDRRTILGKNQTFYLTLDEAANAAQTLQITSRKEYRTRYKEDPKLPSTPEATYKKEWAENGGWLSFLATNKKSHIRKYKNIFEAAEASRKLGFRSAQDYRNGYKQDPLLPCAPDQFYEAEWETIGKWNAFTIG